MENESITTLIFDLDGTLCSYGTNLENSLSRTFDGEPVAFSAEEYQEEFGNQFDKAINDEVDRPDLSFRKRIFFEVLSNKEAGAKDSEVTEGKILELGERFKEIREGSLQLFPEVPEVLEELRSDYQLGLLTNGPSDLQWSKIKILGIESWFEDIVVSGEHGTAKPDPEIFEIALEGLGSDRTHSVYIGNSQKYDVAGANRAGLPVVWRRDESEEEIKDAVPDAVIEDLKPLNNGLLAKKANLKPKKRRK